MDQAAAGLVLPVAGLSSSHGNSSGWRRWYTRPRCSPQCYAQINLESVARVEFESDAPRTIDMDYVAGWNESFQRIKVKPAKFDLFRRRCGVKAGRNRIVSP